MDQSEAQATIQCAAGCGFYGNPASENMCSKCYRDLRSDKTASQSVVVSSPRPQALLQQPSIVPQPTPVRIEPAAEPVSVPAVVVKAPQPATPAANVEDLSATAATPSPKKPKNRCLTCRKKVGLLGFSCRCEGLFCSTHRHAQDHDCGFNYMAFDRERLTKANPVIAPEKIQKI